MLCERRPTGAFKGAPRPVKSPLWSNCSPLLSITVVPLALATTATSDSLSSLEVEPTTTSSPNCQSTAASKSSCFAPAAAVAARYCQENFGVPCSSKRPRTTKAFLTMPLWPWLRLDCRTEASGSPMSSNKSLPWNASLASPSQPAHNSPWTNIDLADNLTSTPVSRAIRSLAPTATVRLTKVRSVGFRASPSTQSWCTCPSCPMMHGVFTTEYGHSVDTIGGGVAVGAGGFGIGGVGAGGLGVWGGKGVGAGGVGVGEEDVQS
mmetsp:Transcript_164177/g.522103  ORF Transcript_164177/g.522103 Transcript_164177/m.522103 type:complete len:264 (+) Transcript_164177:331-1122(+)